MTDIDEFGLPVTKRITIITGHYGSGKTEFAVSLALLRASAKARSYPRMALADLDIVNPYFRSRERASLLEGAGINVYGGIYGAGTSAEIPELSPKIRVPLEDRECSVIVDAGGNDAGALVLNQFGKYFVSGETTVLCVVNANRPETSTFEGARMHLEAIEAATGLRVEGIVNNCHLLRETTAETVAKGHRLCMEVCEKTGRELWCDCYPSPIVAKDALYGVGGRLMPLGLYMRPGWLDR